MKNLVLTLIGFIILGQTISQTTAINESFEEWPPPEWTIITEPGIEYGWRGSILWGIDLGVNGGNCAKHGISTSPMDDWLISPQVYISNAEYELKFYEKSIDAVYYNYSGILISTNSNSPSSGDFMEIAESIQIDDVWTEITIDLSSYAGEYIYIAFVYQGEDENITQWEIDEVKIAPQNLIDGSITEIINPTGINPNPGTEEISLNIHNYGDQVITDFQIEWSVNGNTQTEYQPSGVEILPGEDLIIDIGSYSFTEEGDYILNANLILENDINLPNNQIEGIYTISDPRDISLVYLDPNGYCPSEGNQDIIIYIKNEGDYVIDEFSVSWEVDNQTQEDFQVQALNLLPNEETQIIIGNYNFNIGTHTVSAYLNLSSDENLTNNGKTFYPSIGILWESFEGYSFPPELWTAKNLPFKDNWEYAPHGEYYYHSITDANMFGEISDTLLTPLLNISENDSITFWIQNSSFFPNSPVLIWKDGITGDVHHIQDIIVSEYNQFEEIKIDISEAQGINYIGFVNEAPNSIGVSSLDLISSTANIFLFDNDLGILDFSFESNAKQNLNHEFEIKLKNYGINTIEGENYSIQLINSDNEIIIEENGVDLQNWENHTFIINHVFESIETIDVKVKIAFESDQMIKNNISRTKQLSIIPSDCQSIEVGSPEINSLVIPFNAGGDSWTLGTDDISQTIYYQEEIGNSGYIYGIHLHYSKFYTTHQNLPLNIWIKQTDIDNLEGGWVPTNEMQLVFNDTILVSGTGDNSVYIPFNEPILYTGTQNLLVQFHQYNPEFPFSACRFYSASDPSNANRTIHVNDVYNLDAYTQPEYFNQTTDFPYTTFIYQEIIDNGILYGNVEDMNSQPISNAQIELLETSYITHSNTNGEYTISDIPYSSYEVKASLLGYQDEIQSLDLNNDVTELNFQLSTLPSISILGQVFGSNAPSIPLENVTIALTGYESLNTMSNEAGEFVFESVYGNHDYLLTMQLVGYENYELEFSITDENINLGQIFLTEKHITPFNVYTTVGNSIASIEWETPINSQVNKLQNDGGIANYSLTNEPYEEVSLGNIFYNNELKTIISVDVVWDVYLLNHDFVTVDILDENGNVLVSSTPFLTHNDSIMTIDVPNISVNSDFYAMVHWKNNEFNTDALAVDYNNGINSAYILYPNEEPIILSDFLNIPKISCMIRVNTLEHTKSKDNKEVLSYNVYRGPANEINLAPWEWSPLNSSPITELFYIDNNWTTTNGELTTYAIEAVYEEGNSDFSFSNFVEIITPTEELERMNYKIYPNPTADLLYLEGMESETIFIYNIQGVLIHERKIQSGLEQISLKHLSIGEYLIQVGQNSSSHKLIINK